MNTNRKTDRRESDANRYLGEDRRSPYPPVGLGAYFRHNARTERRK